MVSAPWDRSAGDSTTNLGVSWLVAGIAAGCRFCYGAPRMQCRGHFSDLRGSPQPRRSIDHLRFGWSKVHDSPSATDARATDKEGPPVACRSPAHVRRTD